MSLESSYAVEAYNLSRASENKIHDDAIARRFGFTGGLVPGVEVLAYAAHLPVARFGRAFLEAGVIEMRFLSPVYDGRTATVTARETGGRLALEVLSDGKVCAAGEAMMAVSAGHAQDRFVPRPPEGTFAAPPAHADRPDADEQSLAVGRRLQSLPLLVSPEVAEQYLADVRETDPLYRGEGVLHPGLLLRRCNAVLVDNVRLPPWVHVGSRMTFVAPGRVGEAIAARGTVTANYERKGHRLVDLDLAVTGDGDRHLAQVRHTTIYRLRGDASGQAAAPAA